MSHNQQVGDSRSSCPNIYFTPNHSLIILEIVRRTISQGRGKESILNAVYKRSYLLTDIKYEIAAFIPEGILNIPDPLNVNLSQPKEDIQQLYK